MSHAFESAYYAEEKRHLKAVADLVDRFPERRAHVCYGLLGSAIATADSFGIDVEAFLAKLRTKMPKPAVLVPPKERRS